MSTVYKLEDKVFNHVHTLIKVILKHESNLIIQSTRFSLGLVCHITKALRFVLLLFSKELKAANEIH